MLGSILKSLLPNILGPLLEKIPDVNERRRLEAETTNRIIDATAGAVMAQIEVNKTEAAHPSVFVAGWRPFIGWVCGLGVAWAFVGRPMFTWWAWLAGANVGDVPELDIAELIALLCGMLGVPALRTYDKIRGVARASWGPVPRREE